MILKSYAKLNLYLSVLNKRKDNYHSLLTIFERISLADTIILSSRRDSQITIKCNNPGVPKDNSNLCYRSAKLLQDTFGIEQGLDIKILKRIPVGAGLGGGSSNAAAVLSGLNKLWRINLSQKKLMQLAKSLGCDVPFFIPDVSFAVATGRGDIVKPLKSLKKVRLWHLLVVPKINVSTPLIYKRWDEFVLRKQNRTGLNRFYLSFKQNKKAEYFKGAGLTKPEYSVKLLALALARKNYSLLSKLLFNSLEQVTIDSYSEVKKVKECLTNFGLKAVLMSGSGPAVFGILPSRKEAVSVVRLLKRKRRPWEVFVTRTI